MDVMSEDVVAGSCRSTCISCVCKCCCGCCCCCWFITIGAVRGPPSWRVVGLREPDVVINSHERDAPDPAENRKQRKMRIRNLVDEREFYTNFAVDAKMRILKIERATTWKIAYEGFYPESLVYNNFETIYSSFFPLAYENDSSKWFSNFSYRKIRKINK